MYRAPVDALAERGYTTIQFNPRSHGNSSGQFDISNSVDDINEILRNYNRFDYPIKAIGHSGGCSGLLMLGKQLSIEKLYFCAPVFDSRESLAYMYENGSINEFIGMICTISDQADFIRAILQDNRWMDCKYWESNSLQKQFNSMSKKILIGDFLETLFIKGVNTKTEFEGFYGGVEILLPSKDEWYPLSVTRSMAKARQVPVNDSLGAYDHYMTGAWRQVWNHVLATL